MAEEIDETRRQLVADTTNYENLMKPTVDDKLRLLGIMLTIEEVREFIPDIIGKRRSENGWRPLDDAASRALAAWALLFTKFIDAEVQVKFPEEWSHRFIERAGIENFYEQHGTVNPNNVDRMKLPWTQKLLKSVLKDSWEEYKEVRRVYITSTGGGPGALGNFADWIVMAAAAAVFN